MTTSLSTELSTKARMKKRILFGLTGSIACYKACAAVSALVKKDFDVQVIATRSALQFVGEATLEGLTGNQVISETFVSGRMMDHINLARACDLFVVAPLTAHHAGLFANGLAEDFLSTLYLALESRVPRILAPAMNKEMWATPAVAKNIKKISQFNQILWPNSGLLACGEDGLGKMQEPEQIVTAIENYFTNYQKNSGQKILVTFGGTQEPIDGVRVIANSSTGQTGATICDELLQAGYQVTALHAKGSKLPKLANASHARLISFTSHKDLDEKLQSLLFENQYSTIVHLAAVSDFAVEKIEIEGVAKAATVEAKIDSDHPMILHLVPAKKLVHHLKDYAQNRSLKVIAFKLTRTDDQNDRHRAVKKLFGDAHIIDCVIHNDENEIDRDNNLHPYTLYFKNGRQIKLHSTTELAHQISSLVSLDSPKDPEAPNDLMP